MLQSEYILHYIWKYRLFHHQDLFTACNLPVEVQHAGLTNQDAGPDFTQAKIKIGDTVWAGNVEIHLRSSDWFKHQHQKDAAYDNVILHVVWENDVVVYRTDATPIPALELKDRVFEGIIDRIDSLLNNQQWIACQHRLPQISPMVINPWIDRMLIERLEDKSAYFTALNQLLKGSWEDTFYVGLAKSFGFKINALPFELLAKMLPQSILAKHKTQPFQIEALIFGMSGLLNRSFKDDYPQRLKQEFSFLSKKYGLNPIEPHLWKFARTRPDNFPTIRLAQFAALIVNAVHLFSKIIEQKKVSGLRSLFENLQVHEYWTTHYLFDKAQSGKIKALGSSSIDVLIINAIVPLVFAYEKSLGKVGREQTAVQILEAMKPEKNHIITQFERFNIKAQHAFESQALIQLKNVYCNHKKCLNCGIGLSVLKSV